MLNQMTSWDGTYPVVVPSTVDTGELVAVGSIVGVAEVTASQGNVSGAQGLRATLALSGVYRFSTSDSFTVGAKVYALNTGLAAGTSTVQTSATSATEVGKAVEITAGGYVWVLINFRGGI
jgi:predicted RecA/RadA family phage recombinase